MFPNKNSVPPPEKGRVYVTVSSGSVRLEGVWPGWSRAISLMLTQSPMHPVTERLTEALREMRTGDRDALEYFFDSLAHYNIEGNLAGGSFAEWAREVRTYVVHGTPADPMGPVEVYQILQDTLLSFLKDNGEVRIGEAYLSAEHVPEQSRSSQRAPAFS